MIEGFVAIEGRRKAPCIDAIEGFVAVLGIRDFVAGMEASWRLEKVEKGLETIRQLIRRTIIMTRRRGGCRGEDGEDEDEGGLCEMVPMLT